MAALAEIATVLRENVHRVRAEGRTLSVPWTITRKPAPGKGFVAESPIKEGEKHRDEEKIAAALRKEISAAQERPHL